MTYEVRCQRQTAMRRACHRSTLCVALIVAIGWCAESPGQDDELPTLDQMVLPEAEQLMTAEPFDWIVLKTGGVLVTEPVYPRPDTLKKMAEEKARLEAEKGGAKQERDLRRERLEKLKKIEIVLPENQAEDYLLPVGQVEQIISFERLMLQRVDKLLEAGNVPQAYELLMAVDQRAPNWSETVARFDNLLLREAGLKLQDGEPYAALALMDELAERNLANTELPQMMGTTLDKLIKTSVESRQYSKAQYLINRLAKYYPRHAVVAAWTDQLQQQMTAKLSEARKLSDQKKFSEAAAVAKEADDVWKTTGNQRAEYARYVARYQTLRVPVRRFSDEEIVFPISLDADDRHRELTTVSLFEPSGADELTYYQSSFFDVWDPRDLGREVVFSLRQTRPYWQSQPILTANQIADSLSNHLNPELTAFNPRLASFIREFSVRSPTELQISFNRVPLNLEALFRFPVSGIPADQADNKDAETQVLSNRFQLVEQEQDRRLYQRTAPEPDGLIPTQYHIAQIEEQRYPDRHAMIQAFYRREVDILPHLLPWEIDAFKESGRAFVQEYAIPISHVVVFNPLSESVQSPQLRRALSFGVDRESLLKIVILRDPDMKYGRVASAPWHSGSYANSPLVEAPPYDHYLSYLLRLAALEQLRIPDKQAFVAEAKKRMLDAGEEWDEDVFRFDHAEEIKAVAAHIDLPKLRMVCDPGEVAMLAAEKMVSRWKQLGFDIELTPGDQARAAFTDGDWDLMYRTVRMQEPLLDLWELLLTDESFDVTRLSGYPDWMRQELINLDYSTSFLDAQDRLFRIHRKMSAQAFMIPLWELDDFIAFQRNIAGFAGRPLSIYHGAERWLVKP